MRCFHVSASKLTQAVILYASLAFSRALYAWTQHRVMSRRFAGCRSLHRLTLARFAARSLSILALASGSVGSFRAFGMASLSHFGPAFVQ